MNPGNLNKKIIITALPVLLIGLGISGGCIIVRGACFEVPAWRLNTAIAFGALVSLFIGIVGIIGLLKKIPDWSIIWVTVSWIGFIIMLNVIPRLGIPEFLGNVIVIISLVAGAFILIIISIRDLHTAGLSGIGLSSTLTIILLFIATNISHNEIKIGYYSALVGLAFSILIFIYLKSSNLTKILILFIIIILNGITIYIFDKSMQLIEKESQLHYLLILSNGLLFIGIILNLIITLLRKIFKTAGNKTR